jgi:hypothetical protein
LDRPSLIVVGTGIRFIGQITTESVTWIRISEKVLYLVSDPLASTIITQLNPSAESLRGFYGEGKPRRHSYEEMVARVMECLRSGKQTCLVFYGHPGMFCWPGHAAVHQARHEGYTARMLPAVSAEDCLYADLGLDPSVSGCQSYEATEFLKHGRRADPSSLLILWQVGVIGVPVFTTKGYDRTALRLLIKRLGRSYRSDHEVIVYFAPVQWGAEPVVERMPLGRLARFPLSPTATLCVPPGQHPRPDVEVYERLRLQLPDEGRSRRTLGKRHKVRGKGPRPGVARPAHRGASG